MTGIHEHPQAERLRAARSIGAPPADTDHFKGGVPGSGVADLLVGLAVGGIAILAAIIFVGLIAGFYAVVLSIWAATRPAFWLGVVVVAVLAHLAGWWP